MQGLRQGKRAVCVFSGCNLGIGVAVNWAGTVRAKQWGIQDITSNSVTFLFVYYFIIFMSRLHAVASMTMGCNSWGREVGNSGYYAVASMTMGCKSWDREMGS